MVGSKPRPGPLVAEVGAVPVGVVDLVMWVPPDAVTAGTAVVGVTPRRSLMLVVTFGCRDGDPDPDDPLEPVEPGEPPGGL